MKASAKLASGKSAPRSARALVPNLAPTLLPALATSLDERRAIRGRRKPAKGRSPALQPAEAQPRPDPYGIDFSPFAVFERLFLRTPVRLMRARNNVLDLMFYDIKTIPAETRRKLLEWTDPDGSVLVVCPGNGAVREVTHFEHVDEFLASAEFRSTQVVAIAGVGSSALGTAALAANVADAIGRPVAGIVSGYGLADVVAEGVVGWFVLRPLNQLRQFVDLFLAPLDPLLQKISTDTQPNADPLRLPSYVYGLPEIDTLNQVLSHPDSQVVLAVGHSKGNLSIAAALGDLPSEHAGAQYARMAVVTFGALVELPQSLAKRKQFIGTLDGFGWLNSILPQPWVSVPWATHTLNTALPFHVAAKTELAAGGSATLQSPATLEQAMDKLGGAMRPAHRSMNQWQSLFIDAGIAFQGAIAESWRSLLQGAEHTIKCQQDSARAAVASRARTRH
jgi:hypothetical protein